MHISRHIPVHIRVHGRDAPCRDDPQDNATSKPALQVISGGVALPENRPQKKIASGARKIFVFSLRTQLPSEARVTARFLTEISDQIFACVAEKTMPIAPETAERILVDMARFLIESFDRQRGLAPTRSLAMAEEELRQEQAWRASLRQALLCRDRDAVRQPLRDTATRLGITLDEDGPDWLSLAIEATRLLVDVSEECERRNRGDFAETSIWFRSARAQVERQDQTLSVVPQRREASAPAWMQNTAPLGVVPPARPHAVPTPAATTPAARIAEAPRSQPQMPAVAAGAAAPIVPAPEHISAPATGLVGYPGQLGSTMMTPSWEAPVAPHLDPNRIAEDIVREQARIAARPPKITIDIRRLTPFSQEALKKERGITMGEAFDLFHEVKALGYKDKFEHRQKIDGNKGQRWKISTGNDVIIARKIWCDLLGEDRPFEEISADEVDDALEIIRRIPRDHGKNPDLMATDGYVDLVERADEQEIARADKLKAKLDRKGDATAAEYEGVQIKAAIPRLRADTFVKHCRKPRPIGDMLFKMQLIDENPFSVCSWSTEELNDLRESQDDRARTCWDDRIFRLFRTKVFQGEVSDVGDPLFWAPLMARLMGLRMQECLQLSPEDFGVDMGIHYVTVRNVDGNHVKKKSSERRLPIHPELIRIGLVKLVEIRRQEGLPKIFPHLTRGRAKGKLSENFTKTFGYYRRTNDVYWPGLDFHALRTTFHNDLLNDNKSDAIRRRLMGHAPQDEGEKSYAQGLSIESLLERLASVDIDLSMIKSPFGEADGEPRNVRAEELGLRIV